MKIAHVAACGLILAGSTLTMSSADANYSAEALSGAQYPYSDTANWSHYYGNVYNNRTGSSRRNWAVPITNEVTSGDLFDDGGTYVDRVGVYATLHGHVTVTSCAQAVSRNHLGVVYESTALSCSIPVAQLNLGNLDIPYYGSAYVDFQVADGGGSAGLIVWGE